MGDPRHWWKCVILILVNLNICGIVTVPCQPSSIQLEKAKNICDTKGLTFYCPVGPESCNTMGFDGRDFRKERAHTSEAFLKGCWYCESFPVWDVQHQLLCKIVNENTQKKKAQFKNFPCVLYTTDAIFQEAKYPSGTLLKRKFYLNRKHKLYGIKAEVSLAPTCQAIDVAAHKPGSFSLCYLSGKCRLSPGSACKTC